MLYAGALLETRPVKPRGCSHHYFKSQTYKNKEWLTLWFLFYILVGTACSWSHHCRHWKEFIWIWVWSSKLKLFASSVNFIFLCQNNILLRETGLEGGVTATTDLSAWTVVIHRLSSPSSGLISDQTTGSAAISGGRRRWYQPVHPLLSPSAPGRTASAASSWMSTPLWDVLCLR